MPGPTLEGAVKVRQITISEFRGNLLHRPGCGLNHVDRFFFQDFRNQSFKGCALLRQSVMANQFLFVADYLYLF